MPVSQEALIARAQADYGELAIRIVAWPEGGVNVTLIGNELVQYFVDGSTFTTWRPSWRTRLALWLTRHQR